MSDRLTRRDGPLPGELANAVRSLAQAVQDADGEPPLSEAFLLALDYGDSTHLLLDDAPDTLVGYAQVMPDGVAELVVHPAHRQRGHGATLLRALRDTPARAIWAHGNLTAAQEFAARLGLPIERELHLMTRPLTAADGVDPQLPDWVEVTSYAAHPDRAALTALNAAAFAHHPEQGELTEADLAERMAQPWFDREGLILLRDRTTGSRAPIAFHWTKREGRSGEVYVVGVHPAYQGRGLAKPLTRLGTAYLARQGDTSAHLYVDGDNAAALRTYAALGFSVAHTDLLISLRLRNPSL